MIVAMSPLVLLASTVIITEGIELASSLWRLERRRAVAAIPAGQSRGSIHVPCYNEPPAMVMATLDALSRLHYAQYEAILFDYNAPEASTWLPAEAHGSALWERFRF